MAYTNIDDPSAYFQTTTYTGNGANTEVTNSGNSDLKPDFLWIKNRTAGYGHFVVDSNRNISYAQNSSNAPYLETESTAAENSNQNWMASVNTDGFTTGIAEHINNNSGSAYVAWQWKANGGTTASNTEGNTTTTVQANQDAGFSIVTYTGTGSSSQTMGHGLGVTPNIVLTKARSGTSNWSFNGNFGGMTYGTNRLLLNTTAALTADTNEVTAASSTTFTGGGSAGVNSNGATYVAYCFADVQGYSKFGKYVGNASANGSFIYTGFQPAWVMIKGVDVADDWYIFDNKRAGYNPEVFRLRANTAGAEATGTNNTVDHLSNGFKLRFTGGSINGSGSTYIYMAFAENPFVTSTGVPTTAR